MNGIAESQSALGIEGVERVHDLIRTIKRNNPAFPSTFGMCRICGGNPARGGGTCTSCACEELVRLGLPVGGVDRFRASVEAAAAAEVALMDAMQEAIDER